MKKIKVACKCGQKFGAYDTARGTTMRCPSCGDKVRVPLPSQETEQSGPRCPHCNALAEKDGAVCLACGNDLDAAPSRSRKTSASPNATRLRWKWLLVKHRLPHLAVGVMFVGAGMFGLYDMVPPEIKVPESIVPYVWWALLAVGAFLSHHAVMPMVSLVFAALGGLVLRKRTASAGEDLQSTCWFCEKNEPDCMQVSVRLQRDGDEEVINVPRCLRCYNAHYMVRWIQYYGPLVFALVGIAAAKPGILVGFIVGVIVCWPLSELLFAVIFGLGTKRAGSAEEYPVVLEMLQHGWRITRDT